MIDSMVREGASEKSGNEQSAPALSALKSRWLLSLVIFAIGLSLMTLSVRVGSAFAGPGVFSDVWEDACMFGRYASNFQKFGAIAWDPGGVPTYGLTSPFYFLAIVLPLGGLFPGSPLLLAVSASMISGALFLIALIPLVSVCVPASWAVRVGGIALVFAALTDASLGFSAHMLGGMDTLFGLFYLTMYLLVVCWSERKPGLASAIGTGVLGGLAYGSRPDLLLIPVVISVFTKLFAVDRRRRKLALYMLASTAIVVAAQLLFASYYFHSMFPLSFYAKALRLYPGIHTSYFTSTYQFLDFLKAYRILFLAIAIDIASGPRGWWRAATVTERALTTALVCYFAYFLIGVVQIMPAFQRFFYPSIPAVAYLACCSFARIMSRVSLSWSDAAASAPLGLRLCAFAGVLLCLMPDLEQSQSLSRFLARQLVTFDITAEYRARYLHYWAKLDLFSKLPSDLVIATTETGHVGAMNTDKVVVDLAGLNTALFAHKPFSAAALFAHYRPDLIYMPPAVYARMNQELGDDATFRNDYEYFPAEKLRAGMGIALRLDSKYYARMKRIAETAVSTQEF